jgi:hypothetical protein
MLYQTRGATLIVLSSFVVKEPLFLQLFYDVGTTHLSYLPAVQRHKSKMYVGGFLRSAAHERVLRGHYLSELPLFFGSLLVAALILFSLNAGPLHQMLKV